MNVRLARRAATAIVPRQFRFAIRRAAFRLRFAGDERFCACCESRVRGFTSFGPVGSARPNAQCPVCGALERDRLVARYLARYPQLLARAERVLHVAPERSIAHLLQRRGGVSYVSIDREPGVAMKVMDLTELSFADNSFDAVYCSNVLEHIERDRQAMREISRVLCHGGWAMILVPLYGDATYEDRSVTDPDERTRLYGQADHVRAYGIDIAERLAEAGLDVWVEQPVLGLDAAEALRQGVNPSEIVFFCCKPKPASRTLDGPLDRPLDRPLDGPMAANFVPAFGRQPALRRRYEAAFQINPHLVEAWWRGGRSARAAGSGAG